MAITKLKHHDKCAVKIVVGAYFNQFAHLECANKKCNNPKWIQWIGFKDIDKLEQLGITIEKSPTIKIKGKLFFTEELGL